MQAARPGVLLFFVRSRKPAPVMAHYCGRKRHLAQTRFRSGLEQPPVRRSPRDMSRLEQLQAHIHSGLFRVDTLALARCILIKEAHFFSL